MLFFENKNKIPTFALLQELEAESESQSPGDCLSSLEKLQSYKFQSQKVSKRLGTF